MACCNRISVFDFRNDEMIDYSDEFEKLVAWDRIYTGNWEENLLIGKDLNEQ